MVLLGGVHLAEAFRIAERIRVAIGSLAFEAEGQTFHTTASIGIASVPPAALSIAELILQSQGALHQSKQLGKNRTTLTDAAAGALAPAAPNGRVLLRNLCEGRGLRPVPLPIFFLSEEIPIGSEWLIRGPQGPYESPGSLFQLCSTYNLLHVVDLQCLRTCVAAASLSGDDRIHINLFPSTLMETPTQQILEILPSGPKRAKYCVEISEQQIVGLPEELKDPVKSLKGAGVSIALDDVGFGRSSLESLILLEPDVVKLDRKWTSGIATDSAKQRPLKRLVKVLQALGATLIAEGIETREDLNTLALLGVRYGQGFLWGPPGLAEPGS
jgi:EAL domain-containing protein (putative c-di-GMP-specific phosphodiesterase class I)